MTVSDAFPATIQKLDEDEHLPEDTTAQDDQEDETEQSLSLLSTSSAACAQTFSRKKLKAMWDETREEWQDRTCGQGLEGRLLQDDTGRSRSTDMDRF